MGLYYCHDCDNYKDSKCDGYEVLERKYDEIEICEACAEKRLDEQDRYEIAEGIALAQAEASNA